MRKPFDFFAIALLITGLSTGANVARAEDSTAKIDAVVHKNAAQVMQQYNVPGLAIAVSVNGKTHFYNLGLASKATQAPVTSDTLFEVGSISKVFTATLATYAQANGQLSLNDPVSTYLPEFQNTPFGNVPLMHLATHTGGGFPLQVPDAVQNDAQLMGYLKSWKPEYVAGSKRSYANPSIGMLGLITAKRMNMPYAQALQGQLFPALGLKHSYLNIPASEMPLYAQGYNKQDEPVRLGAGVLADEAYGVKTTARDLIHFAQLNMGLGSTSETVRRALADTHVGYYQVGPMTQDLVWEQYPYPVELKALLDGNSNTMAYETNAAVALTPAQAPQQQVWINKTGSTNGFGGYIAFIPAKKQAVVILANKNYPNAARVELAYAILAALN